MEQSESINLAGQVTTDKSVVVLLLSNLFTIMVAFFQQWDVYFLMWVYWGQSVVIGCFNVHRILDLKRFSTAGFRINNRSVESTPETQRRTAVFFAMHYGFFHLGYLVFLTIGTGTHGGLPVVSVMLCIVVFFVNHRFSCRYNREQEQDRVPNIGSIMFFPYIRIIPMHLTFVAGMPAFGDGTGALVVFLLLKTVADVAMHAIEHAMARRDAPRATRRWS